MLKHLGIVGLVVGALALAPPAQAVPITGGIAFGGDGAPVGSTTWYQATGVDFGSTWFVTGKAGSYSGIPGGTPATFTDVSWGSGSGAVNVPLSQQIWTLTYLGTTYSMNVGTATNIDRGSATNDNISVNGTGTLTISGVLNFDPTPGTWNFTGGFTPQGFPNLSFSSSAAPSVPEPASMMLLGTGLIGLAGAARRRFRKN